VEEFLTIVVIKHDFGSYLFTLLILFPVFLGLVFMSSRLLDRLLHGEATRELTHFFLFGFVGLMVEWLLIGLSPWSNPSANPILMLLFQIGIFSFWSTVAFAPRLFIKDDALNKKTRRAILRFFIPYFMIVYVLGSIVPEKLKFIAIIPLVIFGYSFLNIFYTKYFRQLVTQPIPSAP
jgi:hypothetical protein